MSQVLGTSKSKEIIENYVEIALHILHEKTEEYYNNTKLKTHWFNIDCKTAIRKCRADLRKLNILQTKENLYSK